MPVYLYVDGKMTPKLVNGMHVYSSVLEMEVGDCFVEVQPDGSRYWKTKTIQYLDGKSPIVGCVTMHEVEAV